MSVQWGGAASQKFTWAGRTGTPPEDTTAVRVTSVRVETLVTTLPPEVMVSVVMVGALAQAGCAPSNSHTSANATAAETFTDGTGVNPCRCIVFSGALRQAIAFGGV